MSRDTIPFGIPDASPARVTQALIDLFQSKREIVEHLNFIDNVQMIESVLIVLLLIAVIILFTRK